MYLELDDLEIENKHLTTVSSSHDNHIHFRGRALEGEGKRICERLSKFKKGEVIEVVAETHSYYRYEGICEVVEIKTPSPDIDKAPVVFRFSGILKEIL